MGEVPAGPSIYRLLAQAEADGLIGALIELLDILSTHEVEIRTLTVHPVVADHSEFEIGIEARFGVSPLSAVLVAMVGCDALAVLSAENLQARSTFVLPI